MLRDFPLDRIEFLAPIDETKTQASDQWGLVMDEAWSRFDRDPPKVLRVRVADEPGDKEAREYLWSSLDLCFPSDLEGQGERMADRLIEQTS